MAQLGGVVDPRTGRVDTERLSADVDAHANSKQDRKKRKKRRNDSVSVGGSCQGGARGAVP